MDVLHNLNHTTALVYIVLKYPDLPKCTDWYMVIARYYFMVKFNKQCDKERNLVYSFSRL
jgi:hypothetical protein